MFARSGVDRAVLVLKNLPTEMRSARMKAKTPVAGSASDFGAWSANSARPSNATMLANDAVRAQSGHVNWIAPSAA